MKDLGPEHEVPTTACPGCGDVLDAVTGIGHGHPPRPGDIAICGRCQQILAFRENMDLEIADAEIAAEVTLEISRAQRAITNAKKRTTVE